jgi:SAM-dependent methyltransferase
MDGFRSELYGDRAARTYDDRYADFRPSTEMLALLGEYAGSAAVEVGVGTGRVAIPLAERGVHVTGVDVSPGMIERLLDHAGSLPIDGIVADAGSFTLPSRTRFIYCVFNTFYQIGDSVQQAAFLRNAADNLIDAGAALLIEVGIFRPEYVTIPTGINVTHFDAEQIVLQVYSHDAERQTISKQEAVLRHGEPVRLIPSVQHYLSPDQLVDLAGECGLRATARYGGWSREPLTADSADAIILLQKTA